MTPYEASYNAYLDDALGLEPSIVETQQGAHGRFAITDKARADWALRKLAQLDQEKRSRASFVAEEMARLKAWQQQEDARDERFCEFLLLCLRQYYEQLEADGVVSAKRKSYRLPHGVLTKVHRQAEFERDDKTLLAWCRMYRPDFIRTKAEVAWDELKLMLEVVQVESGVGYQAIIEHIDQETGEVRQMPVNGLRVIQPARDVFQARPQIDSD